MRSRHRVFDSHHAQLSQHVSQQHPSFCRTRDSTSNRSSRHLPSKSNFHKNSRGMQSEQPHGQASDSTPFPPSSPTLFRHRPQPDGPEPSGLHHRLPRTTSQESQQSSSHSVRIRIQSPFDASGASLERRKEGWVLPSHETIGQLKDDLAHGRLEGAGLWVRDDMRIVYHGRIVRDQEKVGDVVGKVGHELLDSCRCGSLPGSFRD